MPPFSPRQGPIWAHLRPAGGKVEDFGGTWWRTLFKEGGHSPGTGNPGLRRLPRAAAAAQPAGATRHRHRHERLKHKKAHEWALVRLAKILVATVRTRSHRPFPLAAPGHAGAGAAQRPAYCSRRRSSHFSSRLFMKPLFCLAPALLPALPGLCGSAPNLGLETAK